MKPQQPSFGELSELMSLLFDGSLTPAEAARLEQLVAASEEARRRFLDCVLVHGELCWHGARDARGIAAEDDLDSQPDLHVEPAMPSRPHMSVWPNLPPNRTFGQPSTRLSNRSVTTLLAGALVLLIGVILSLAGISPGELGRQAQRFFAGDEGASSRDTEGPGSRPSGSSERVLIVNTRGAQWSQGAAPEADGSVPLGRMLRLSRGRAEVVFPRGTHVTLEGPAALDSLSADSARFLEGQLTVRVPPKAVGFAIDTPDARIVDLGTEFSVAVKKNEWTEVEVVSGRVDIAPAAGQAWSRTLAKGEAVRILSSVPADQDPVQPIGFGTRKYDR